jgi:hypothetical protein
MTEGMSAAAHGREVARRNGVSWLIGGFVVRHYRLLGGLAVFATACRLGLPALYSAALAVLPWILMPPAKVKE